MEGTVASVPPQGGRKHPQQEFLQVDTSNILFVCGGAFAGIEKILANKDRGQTLGFGADVKPPEEGNVGELLQNLEPEDLVKYGLIPEFIGRLPLIATLENLDEDALITILTEPKNALIKQYKKLFEIEGAELEFTDDALRAVAEQAIKRKTGARGLRSILEVLLLDTMYDLPDKENVEKVVVTGNVVNGKEQPTFVFADKKKKKKSKKEDSGDDKKDDKKPVSKK